MLFDAKLLAALIFIALSLALIFSIKSRINIITTLIIAHLFLLLFLSLTITSYNSFKEIVLTLVIYLMTILFLIINNSTGDLAKKEKIMWKSNFSKIFLAIFLGSVIFFGVFSLTKTSVNTLQLLRTRTIENQAAPEPELFLTDNIDRKKMRLKQELNNNFLLKRSSDIILIIAVVGCMILLFSQIEIKRKKE